MVFEYQVDHRNSFIISPSLAPTDFVVWFVSSIIHGSGKAAKSVIWMQTEEQKMEYRPGSEARSHPLCTTFHYANCVCTSPSDSGQYWDDWRTHTKTRVSTEEGEAAICSFIKHHSYARLSIIHFVTAYSMQKWRGRPGLFYYIKWHHVYRARQRLWVQTN